MQAPDAERALLLKNFSAKSMAIAADSSEFACFNQALPQPSLPTQDQIKLPKNST